MGSGWEVGNAPILRAIWEEEPGNQWTIPWGAPSSKATHSGMQLINLILGYYVNAEHSKGAAETQTGFQVNFMFPSTKN